MNGRLARARAHLGLGEVFAVLLVHGAAFSLIPGLLGIVSVQHWRHLEELELESVYGDSYRSYRQSTWF